MDPKELRNKIAELLGRKMTAKDPADLSAFTPEELAKVKEAFDEAIAEKDLTTANELKPVVLAAKEELAAREAADSKLEAELAALAAEVEATDAPPADEGDDSGDDGDSGDSSDSGDDNGNADDAPAETTQTVEAGTEAQPITVNVDVPPVDIAAVAAAVREQLNITAAADETVVPDPSDLPDTPSNVVRITAAGDVKGHSAGTEMKPADLADAFVNKGKSLMASAGKKGSSPKTALATLEWDYPEDRQLDLHDHPDVTTAKIQKVVAEAQDRTRENLAAIRAAGGDMEKLVALTAAGGLCAPVNVRYDIFTLGSTERPLRDSLVRFNANRGGINFNAPPTLVDVDGSVAIYTESDDASGDSYPKDCLVVDCGELVTRKVDAVTLCMTVGNFQRLSFPENFQAWWQLGRVWHARRAEASLWSKMIADAIDLTAATPIGAARDILSTMARACAQYRDRHRIGDDTPMRVHMPEWAVTLMQIDLLYQAPGDSTLAVTKAQIAQYFANFNIAVTFVKDGQPAGIGGYAQTAGTLNDFPVDIDFIVSVDGQLLFLDMGTLDFGTEIRDFTLIRNNDTGAFMETFENFANVGPDFEHIQMTSVCADGTTAGPDASLTCAS